MPTVRQQLAAALLGEPVHIWIARQRAAGTHWHVLARNLATATDGQIDVSVQTLHLWAKADEPAAVA